MKEKEKTIKSFEELPLMLSVLMVGKILGISRTKAYELVKEKDFPSIKIGSRVVVPRDKFIQWIERSVCQK